MSRRDNRDARCATCQMFRALCICELTPRLRSRTRVALLVHYREARKPTNTGQLAVRCLERSSIDIIGDRDRPLRPLEFRDDETPILLFPDGDAVPIARFAASDRPIALVVPDGNWRQAGKMRRRVPGLAAIPCATLPGQEATTYQLRAEQRAGGLATLEAIARAIAILEGDAGPAIEAAMLAVFRVMVDRTLALRRGVTHLA